MKKWTLSFVAVLSLFLIGVLVYQYTPNFQEEIVLWDILEEGQSENVPDEEAVSETEDIEDGEEGDKADNEETDTSSDADDTDKEIKEPDDLNNDSINDQIQVEDSLDKQEKENSDDSRDNGLSSYEWRENTDESPTEALNDISPTALVTSWNITISIPDYNATNGRTFGTTYDATITVNFGDATSPNKKIEIFIPEGLNYQSFPVLTANPTAPASTMNPILVEFVDWVTTPTAKPIYGSYNGLLTYNIKPNAEIIEIPLKLRVDEILYYGPKTFSGAEAIVVNAYKNGDMIDSANMDVKAIGNVWNTIIRSILRNTPQGISWSNVNIPTATFALWRSDTSFYVKSSKVYYYYPTALRVVSGGTIYEGSGYVLQTGGPGIGGQFSALQLSAEYTPTGTYTASQPVQAEIEFYDGTTTTYTTANILSVNVLSPDDIVNKTTLSVGWRSYYPYADNYYVPLPMFNLKNDKPIILTGQWMEYIIDSNYQVSQVMFPYNQNPVTSVEYTTTVGPEHKIASGSQLTTNGSTKGIDKFVLGLADEEYITWAKAYIGNFGIGYLHAQWIQGSSMRVLGKLPAGVTATTAVTLKTYALTASGEVDPLTLSSVAGGVGRNSAPTTIITRTSPTISINADSIQRVTWTLNHQANGNDYAVIDPIIYIRIPPEVEILTWTILVKNNIGETYPVHPIGPYQSAVSGEWFLALPIQGKLGGYFDNKMYNITCTFDVKAGLKAKGLYPWKDYVFIQDPTNNTNMYINYNGETRTADVLDIDNDWNTTELFSYLASAGGVVNANGLNIIPNKNLLISTYLIPSGGTKQPAYDITQPQTAIPFTPSSNGTYTVEFFNNRDDVVDFLETYLPIPRVGNNYWTQFQSTGFSWDMKLAGTPTITIYDRTGNNITATVGANYQIMYSADATSEANYQGANYYLNLPNPTMIKMTNPIGMQPWERAILTFTYAGDEDEASIVAHPERLGTINDFRPYYRFEAGSAGRQNGTRVGVALQVGSIWGILFLDENADGIYNTGEIKLTNKTVNLYKDTTYQTTLQTDSSGVYLFSGLSNGVYKVDFNDALDTYEYFTLKGTGADTAQNSKVEYLGANAGYVLNIDPVQLSSTTINAGILNYDPDIDLTVALNITGTTLTLTTTGSNPTTGLVANISPVFFSNIQATTNPVARSSNNPTVASVSSTGLVEGKTQGTATITLTIKDLRGNTKTTTALITVENKIPLSCEVDYTPSTNTNTNVVATLTNCNKPITVTNTGASTTYVFTGNGSYLFTYQDSYGNTGSTLAEVDRIDKTPIIPILSYSTTWRTNQDVIANIAFNKSWVTITSVGGASHTFTGNASFTFTYHDEYGNNGSEIATVSQIDKDVPICTPVYNPEINTNGNVTATLNCSETITVTNHTSTSYIYTGNGDFTFQFVDRAGNTGSTFTEVTRIDASDIHSTFTFSTTGATSGNVTATISFDKPDVTISTTSGTTTTTLPNDTHTFTENGTFTFAYYDTFGNTGSSSVTVNWIDKTAPTCDIAYSPSTNTNQDVIASLVNCSEAITWTANSHTFTGNGSFTFTFTDLVGNTGSAAATVNRINKTPIIPTITYSTTGATSGNVTATISFNKTGVTITSTGGTGHLFTGNGSFTFIYHDDYGNNGSETAIVNWIDKTAPTCNVSYDPTGPTNQDVVASLVSCSETITVLNNSGSSNYTFTENGSFTFNFTDLVGNTGSATATVSWIDKTAIVPTITYNITGATNQNVTASIAFNKSWVTITSEGGATHTFTTTGSFTFHFHDDYGNTGSKLVTVDRIDKTAPILTLTYDPATSTNQDVLVTLITDEPVTKPTNWSGSATGTLFTRTYTQNVSEPITVYDLVGNQGQRWLTIDRINKTAVTGSIAYDIETPTSGNVTATISFNKSWVTITNNSGSDTFIFTGNGSFTFHFHDVYGNTGSETAEVSWIDIPIILPPTTNGAGNWWGGTTLEKDDCPDGDFSPSYYDKKCEAEAEHNAPDEEDSTKTLYETAYERAKGYGITTASTYEDVRISDAILRQEMAKMISTYAIKLFQKTPTTSKVACSQFQDVSEVPTELQPYIIQSCELGLMGMHGDGIQVQDNFFPKSFISRAEVGTILSRLLRGTTYATQPGDETYYTRHLQALKKAGIMNFISNPDMLELRGNILLMLWKSVTK